MYVNDDEGEVCCIYLKCAEAGCGADFFGSQCVVAPTSVRCAPTKEQVYVVAVLHIIHADMAVSTRKKQPDGR